MKVSQMKYILTYIFLILSAALPLCAEEAKQSLIVEVPETWKVEFEIVNEADSYTVTKKEDDTSRLIFTPFPIPGNVKQIPEYIEAMAKGFVSDAEHNKDIKLKTGKYKVEEIAGDTFSGSFVQFELDGGITKTMFMIGYPEGIWNGRFTGTKEQWVEALSIIKKLKKNRNPAEDPFAGGADQAEDAAKDPFAE